MRVYLEAREQIEQDGEFHRLDVTGKTAEEQAIILAKFKEFMAGIDCVFTRHACYHDTGGSCITETV